MELAEVDREIRRCVDTGKVVFGQKETEKNVLKGLGQLIIVSANAPARTREKTSHWGLVHQIPVFSYPGKGLELGSVAGQPFGIATMLVLDKGKSKVLEIGTKPKPKKTTN